MSDWKEAKREVSEKPTILIEEADDFIEIRSMPTKQQVLLMIILVCFVVCF